MPTVERTLTVDQPVTKVLDYLADFTRTEEWDPPTRSTTRTSGDGGVGTTYHNVSRLLGKDNEVEYVVVAHEPPRLLRLESESGPIWMTDTITLEETGAGTTVTYHLDVRPQGAARLAEPLLPLGLRKLADDTIASLEECLRRL